MLTLIMPAPEEPVNPPREEEPVEELPTFYEDEIPLEVILFGGPFYRIAP